MSRCKSCGAEIIWATTEIGNTIPLDAEPTERPAGLFRLIEDGFGGHRAISAAGGLFHITHFATCPDADAHRKEALKR
jgi:hypothetical protein